MRLYDVVRRRENNIIYVRDEIQGGIVVVHIHINIEVILTGGQIIEAELRRSPRRPLFDDAIHQPGIGGCDGRWIDIIIPTVVRSECQRHSGRCADAIDQGPGGAVFCRAEIVGIINVVPVWLRDNTGDICRS